MEDRELNLSIIRLGKKHFRRSGAEFAKIGVTKGQPKILDYLAENDGCIQRELAKHCHIEPATVTSVLGGMEKQGLIYRVPSKTDKRVLNVFLTEEGKEGQRKVTSVHEKLGREAFEGFSEDEKELAVSFLKRMYNNLMEGEKNKND